MTPGQDADLLQAYLDGTLTPSEVAAVEARLIAEPALAVAFVALTREEIVIRSWAASARLTETAIALRAVDEPAEVRPSLESGRVHRRPLPIWPSALAASILLLATVALAMLGWRWPVEPVVHHPTVPPADSFALLEDPEGDVSVGGVAAPAGPLQAGAEVGIGEDGAAAIRFPDGSRMLLGAGTRVGVHRVEPSDPTNHSGVRVFLHEGALVAEVAPRPEGRPMVVATPHAEITGTHFRSASTLAATMVEPEDGRVEVRRTGDNAPRVVEAGSYAVFGGGVAGRFESLPRPPRVVQPRVILPLGQRGRDAAWVGTTLAALRWDDGRAVLWDPADFSVRTNIDTQVARSLGLLALSPDGRTLATAGERTARIWTLDGREIAGLSGLRETHALTYSPDGGILALAGRQDKREGGRVRLIDLANGEPLPPLTAFAKEARAVAFSPNGRLLAIGTEDGLVHVHDRAGRVPPVILTGHLKGVRCLTWSPDSRTLASGSQDGTVRLWDAETRAERAVLLGTGGVKCVAFSPDGKWLASDAGGSTARLWDVATGRERCSFEAHKHAVASLAFSPDSRQLLTTGWDPRALVWDVPAE